MSQQSKADLLKKARGNTPEAPGPGETAESSELVVVPIRFPPALLQEFDEWTAAAKRRERVRQLPMAAVVRVLVRKMLADPAYAKEVLEQVLSER